MVKRKTSERIGSLTRYIVALGAIFFALFPVFWMAGISFKPPDEWITREVIWFPQNPTIDNYLPLFYTAEQLGLFVWTAVSQTAVKSIQNSLIASLGGAALALFIGTTAAYAMSRYKAGGNFMPYLFLTFRMLPPMAIIVPLVIWFTTLNLIDNIFGLVLLYGLFQMPFVIWLMRSFFDEIPVEIDEAALIDGCTPLQTFVQVVLPLVKAGLAVTGLFIFILNWSDLIVALTMTRKEAVTATVQLGSYMAETGQLYGVMAALGIILLVPPVIMGLAIQRYLVRGFTFGAVKG